jgi:hypothetical protein
MLVCVSLHYLARETAGAARTRSSLRPHFPEGGKPMTNLARSKRRDRGLISHRHCEERSDEAIHAFLCGQMDCFAIARNDGLDHRAISLTVVPAHTGTHTPRLLSWHAGRWLLQPSRSVVMGPCVRRDDTNLSGATHGLDFKKFQTRKNLFPETGARGCRNSRNSDAVNQRCRCPSAGGGPPVTSVLREKIHVQS